MKKILHVVVVVVSGILVPASASAQSVAPEGPGVTVLTASPDAAIAIDGEMSEPAWDAAAVLPLPFEISPGENQPAPLTTLCRLTYDRDHFYVGCQAHDPAPTRIRANYTDRDLVEGQDRIVITLDPYRDFRRAWQFGVTALGVQYDGTVTQEGQQASRAARLQGDAAWDAIWDAAATLTGDGYVIEAAIPFRALRFPPVAADRPWGIAITRYAPRDRELELRNVAWDRANGCGLCQTSQMVGLAGVSPGGLLQLTPSMTFGRTDVRTRSSMGLQRGALDVQPALDARWNVTSDLAAAATVNPDFSQVEADALQLDVNTRFALFFPEKRPFFLDGAELLATPLRAVFTRTIADPIGGARITGSLSGTTIGALVATDARPNLLLPGSQFSSQAQLDTNVTTVITRLRRDLGASSSAGVLFTNRQGGEYANRVFGADALLRPTAALSARVQLVGSATRYPDEVAAQMDTSSGPSPSGLGGYASVRYAPRNWLAVVDSQWLTPGVRLDTGFEPRVNVRTLNGSLRRRFWGDSASWFSQLATGAGFWYSEDFSGRLLDQSLWLGAEYDGPRQSVVWVFLNFAQRERIDTHASPRFWTGFIRASVAPTRWYAAELIAEHGGAVDLANGRLSDSLMLSPSLTLRPGRHLHLRVNHTMRRLTHRGAHVFTAHGSETRATYNINARSFVRAVVQYESTSRNPVAYIAVVDSDERRLATQWHYSYKVNPQTVLFVGYADGRQAVAILPGAQDPLLPSDRTFFLKIGYAWRL